MNCRGLAGPLWWRMPLAPMLLCHTRRPTARCLGAAFTPPPPPFVCLPARSVVRAVSPRRRIHRSNTDDTMRLHKIAVFVKWGKNCINVHYAWSFGDTNPCSPQTYQQPDLTHHISVPHSTHAHLSPAHHFPRCPIFCRRRISSSLLRHSIFSPPLSFVTINHEAFDDNSCNDGSFGV